MAHSVLNKIVRIILLSFATRRLTSLIVHDEIVRPLRERVITKFPPETTKIGYLITCVKCVSVWAAIVVLALDYLFDNVSLEESRTEVRSRSLGGFLLDMMTLSEITIIAENTERTSSTSMFD